MASDQVAQFVIQFIEQVEARGERYDCTVAEVYDRFIDDVIDASKCSWTRTEIERAIKKNDTLRRHPMLQRKLSFDDVEIGVSIQTAVEEDNRRVQAINAEATRILDEIGNQLKQMLIDGSYKVFSNPVDNEWMAAVTVKYSVAAAFAVEKEVSLYYQRKFSLQRRHRPYLTDIFRFNIRKPLRVEPKRVFCTTFYFHFIENPETIYR